MKTNLLNSAKKIFIAIAIWATHFLTPQLLHSQSLVTNSTFDAGTTGWTGGCSVETGPETSYGGPSTTNNVTEVDRQRCLSQQVCILPGMTYNFSFNAQRRPDPSAPATVGIVAKIIGLTTGTNYVNVILNYSNTTWSFTAQSYSFTIPAGSTDKYVTISIVDNSNHSTYGVVMDDVDINPSTALSINGNAATVPNVNNTYSVQNIPASGISYSWAFDAGSNPTTSVLSSPTVQWMTMGIKNVTVALSNGTCSIPALSKIVDVTNVLAVDIRSFTAKAVNGSVDLNWVTDNEFDDRDFVIERSTTGILYDSIGVVAAVNNVNEHTYNFKDNSTPTGNAYYRLKQVAVNGSSHLSTVIKVKSNSLNGLNLAAYPNPAQNSLTCNFVLAASSITTIEITNIAGKLVYHQMYAGNTGMNQLKLNMTNIPNGIYVLKIQNEQAIHSVQKFVVLK